jgi:hypothetical protein
MKPITFHPLSVLAGAASILLLLFAMGQTPITQKLLPPVGGPEQAIRPDNWVLIPNAGGNQPVNPDYVVPLNKTLVVTGVVNRLGVSEAVEILTGTYPASNRIARTRIGGGTYAAGGGASPDAPSAQTFRTGPVHGIPVNAGEEIRLEVGSAPANAVWVTGYLVDA